METVSLTVDVQPLKVPPGWLIAPRSFLVDRIVPDVEQIYLPELESGGGSVVIERGDFIYSYGQPGRMKRLKRRMRRDPPQAMAGPIFDLRAGNPGNWAHFLNTHMALLALVCRECDLSWRDIQLLLPSSSPGYIRALVELLELRVAYGDGDVSGLGIRYRLQAKDWDFIRGERHDLLRNPRWSPAAAALQEGRITLGNTPSRLLIVRKDTRTLSNESEIFEVLRPHGFEVCDPMDLDVAEQIATIAGAEKIVSIHGAALAPMIYRPHDKEPLKLAELLPVGHMTNNFRAMATALGGTWSGVRGYLEADQVSEIYRYGQPYTKHSLRSFRADPASVEVALERALIV